MSISIVSSATRSAWLSPVSASSPLMPKATGVSNEEKSQSATVSISDRAKAASVALDKWGLESNGTAYSKDFFTKINSLQGQDKVDAYTQAAMQVSSEQGLPPGQFDFSKMTRGQALVAANYLQLTANSSDDRAAATGMIDALNNSFSSDAPFTDSTFDVRQLVNKASQTSTDASTSKSYTAAVGLIDHFKEVWAKMNAGSSSAASTGVTITYNADGTTTSSSTSASHTV